MTVAIIPVIHAPRSVFLCSATHDRKPDTCGLSPQHQPSGYDTSGRSNSCIDFGDNTLEWLGLDPDQFLHLREIPTSDGRTLILQRYTQAQADIRLTLERLRLTLSAQPPPRITVTPLKRTLPRSADFRSGSPLLTPRRKFHPSNPRSRVKRLAQRRLVSLWAST